MESFGSPWEHHADGDFTLLLKILRDGGIPKQMLFRSVRFWSRSYRNDSWEADRGNNDSIYGWKFCIQRCG